MNRVAEIFHEFDLLYRQEDVLAKDVEAEPATPQETQWYKGLQFKRALKNAQLGRATTAELTYLYRKARLIFPGTKNALKAELFVPMPQPEEKI